MEDAIDTVVVAKLGAHQVAWNVQNDQTLQILEFNCLLHIAYQVITKVEFHQALQVFQSI